MSDERGRLSVGCGGAMAAGTAPAVGTATARRQPEGAERVQAQMPNSEDKSVGGRPLQRSCESWLRIPLALGSLRLRLAVAVLTAGAVPIIPAGSWLAWGEVRPGCVTENGGRARASWGPLTAQSSGPSAEDSPKEVAEHVFGFDAIVEAGLAGFDGAVEEG